MSKGRVDAGKKSEELQGTLDLMTLKTLQGMWGASENNRKAKLYSITKSGLKQLATETEDSERISAVIGRVLRLASEKS